MSNYYTTSETIFLYFKMFGAFLLIIGVLKGITYLYNKWTGKGWMNN